MSDLADDDDWPFETGSEVEGRYRIVRRLQKGSAGAVYEAEHKWTGHRVALKALHKRVRDHADRMRAEARALAEISHPNVVAITDGGVTTEAPMAGVVWFAMPLLHGRNLREELNRCGALDPARALRFAIQIADGSAAAHALGIVHRDLKPENVFVVEADDSLKVLDFGVSKIRNKLRPTELRTTDKFRLLGTEAYMSPELIQIGDADPRSDVYALGLILYEMLIGRHCWSDDPGPLTFPSRAVLGARQIHAQPVSLAELLPHLPEQVDRIVMRALDKNPERRQQSMGELSRELGEALKSFGTSPPPALVQRETVRIDSIPTLESERPPIVPVRASGPVAIRSADTDASLDAALVCGVARFACESGELTNIERGLRVLAGIEGRDGRFRGLLRWMADEMLGAPESLCARRRKMFDAIGSVGGAQAGAFLNDMRGMAATRGWTPDAKQPAPISRVDRSRAAAAFVDPKLRSDAAETALTRLGGIDEDTREFAFSVLIAFARTPPETHATPRGALLALALGGSADSELARNGLAEFVLSAASARDLGVDTRSIDVGEPPSISSVPNEVDEQEQTMPTPSSMATPAEPRASDRGQSRFNALLAFAMAATLAVSIGILGVVLNKPEGDAPSSGATNAAPSQSATPSSLPQVLPTAAASSSAAPPPPAPSAASTQATSGSKAEAPAPSHVDAVVRSATSATAKSTAGKPAPSPAGLPGSGL